MLSLCKKDTTNRKAEVVITSALAPTTNFLPKDSQNSQEKTWLDGNSAPASYFKKYFSLAHQIKNDNSTIQKIQCPVSCVVWLPKKNVTDNQLVVAKCSHDVRNYSLQLHDLTVEKTLTTLKIPPWPLSFLTTCKCGNDFKIAFWSPFKDKVIIVKVDTAKQKLIQEACIYIREGIYEILLTKNSQDLWAISSYRPSVHYVNLRSKKNICRFFVYKEKEEKEPISLCRYKVTYLEDLEAGLLVGFNENSFVIANILTVERKACVLFNSKTFKSSKHLLSSPLSLDYRDSNLVVLCEGGSHVLIFNVEGKANKVSVNLKMQFCISNAIIRQIGEAHQGCLYKKNNWLLLNHRAHISLVWVGEENNTYSFIVALDLPGKECLNDWNVYGDELWVSTPQKLYLYKISEFIQPKNFDEQLREFDFPITAVRKAIYSKRTKPNDHKESFKE